MYFIVDTDERPGGYNVITETPQWVRWLGRNVPTSPDKDVRNRLISNLKHLIVGLELKAALIEAHRSQGPGNRPVLFESYFQNIILEFCVASFSVLEGLGSAHWLEREGRDGADGPAIRRNQWLPALCAVYDETGDHRLLANVGNTLAVRDRLHQDKIGARDRIDWHAFSYDAAFAPASAAIRTLLLREAEVVPETTNLREQPA